MISYNLSGKDMSSNMQDYLVEILLLNEKHGHAHAGDIASALNVSRPSVTHALRILGKEQYLRYRPSAPVVLTDTGKALAEQLLHSRETIFKFFSDVLYVPDHEAMKCSCALEHAISEKAIHALEVLTDAVMKHQDCEILRMYLRERLFLKLDLDDANKIKETSCKEF